MNKGKVKWFNDAKGYGFIVVDNDEKTEAFVHYSAILGEGFKTLVEDQEVEFELYEGKYGLEARNIKKLNKLNEIGRQPLSKREPYYD